MVVYIILDSVFQRNGIPSIPAKVMNPVFIGTGIQNLKLFQFTQPFKNILFFVQS